MFECVCVCVFVFVCHLSSTANQHMLRTLAQAGGGAYEMFDTKTEHNWKEKVSLKLMIIVWWCLPLETQEGAQQKAFGEHN